ncbi:SDR family oxidoreductase [Rhodococcus opacus]|uniref:SDR family oxidoreductase n=1 Tax=Rhodococcus opacus TaxID=37919 RepID=UPI0022368380|nr:SDR family NAD(P)-dependent oxidoreductase [Rhodococcus opacus]UZG60001.1 SDR family NAD(P)-dependent oxidoreductase [Rhodococcus opacus]
MVGDPNAPAETAVVVDAATGLGEATARALANGGFHVVLGATGADRCVELAADIGGEAMHLDVTSEDSVHSFAERIHSVSALIIASGPRRLESREDASTDDWRWRWETNILGALRLTKAFLPHLAAADDGIIVVVSTAENSCTECIEPDGGAVYSETRALDRLLEAEVSNSGVRLAKVRSAPTEEATTRSEHLRAAQHMPGGLYRDYSPRMASDVADFISYVVTGPAKSFVEEISIRPRLDASPASDRLS